jgi:hypothetical protein
VSGRGRVRAISRQSGDTAWEAKDLGLTPEMILAGDVLYIRTGGQFTRLKDGDIVERGPYGVSAIDTRSGKVLWRYKGADKGITNLLLRDNNTIAIADGDKLMLIDTNLGKRTFYKSHKIERPSFGLINERGDVVIGGQSEIAAFDISQGRGELWRARHTPPGRGILRTIGAIAARAASLYFRFGGPAMTAFRAASAFSNLQSLATVATRRSKPPLSRFNRYGIASRQLDRLSRYLWHRERLATMRGQWMYFYTSHGLVGVNVNNGRSDREIRLSELDERFITDEVLGSMFTASGEKLFSHGLNR